VDNSVPPGEADSFHFEGDNLQFFLSLGKTEGGTSTPRLAPKVTERILESTSRLSVGDIRLEQLSKGKRYPMMNSDVAKSPVVPARETALSPKGAPPTKSAPPEPFNFLDFKFTWHVTQSIENSQQRLNDLSVHAKMMGMKFYFEHSQWMKLISFLDHHLSDEALLESKTMSPRPPSPSPVLSPPPTETKANLPRSPSSPLLAIPETKTPLPRAPSPSPAATEPKINIPRSPSSPLLVIPETKTPLPRAPSPSPTSVAAAIETKATLPRSPSSPSLAVPDAKTGPAITVTTEGGAGVKVPSATAKQIAQEKIKEGLIRRFNLIKDWNDISIRLEVRNNIPIASFTSYNSLACICRS
jgi:hypothetical protein